jgi:hypothetical protein
MRGGDQPASESRTISSRSRAVGYLAGLARKAIEVGNLASHIEILEAVLKQRPWGSRA